MRKFLVKLYVLFINQKMFWSNIRFGFSFAKAALYYRCYDKYSDKYSDKYNKALLRFFEKNLKPLVKKNQNLPAITERKDSGKIPVWFCWLQGEENMPDIIKACYVNRKRLIPSDIAEVKFIDLSNLSDYVELPQYILKKYRKGKIGHAHFSDIIRFSLLAKYGGLWLDATIYLTKEFSEKYLCADFFSLKSLPDKNGGWAKWVGPVLGSNGINALFLFSKDALYRYWRKYNKTIDYSFFDIILKFAYNNLEKVRQVMDALEPVVDSVSDYFGLYYDNMQTAYSEKMFEGINKKIFIHKMSHKEPIKAYDENGSMTFYGKLLETEGLPIKDYEKK